jgi:hypothetical protein
MSPMDFLEAVLAPGDRVHFSNGNYKAADAHTAHEGVFLRLSMQARFKGSCQHR